LTRKETFMIAYGFVTFFLMFAALYAIFIYAPEEKTMGITQKIFYLHVSSAFIAFLGFFITFIGSIFYLYKKEPGFDILAACSAEIGVLFCSIVLITGPLWAKPIWNVWWTWDPRLTTTLVLWFVYIAYLMLRAATAENKRANISAVLGIIGFVNVPITFLAARLFRTIHPVVITSSSINISSAMKHTLVLTLGAFCLFFFFLLLSRMRLEGSKIKLAELTDMLEDLFEEKCVVLN